MRRLRTLLGLDAPQETRVFLVIGGLGLVLGLAYWFVSYELAGSALLIGFGLASGLVGVFLALDPAAARVRHRVRERDDGADVDVGAGRKDVSGGGTGGVDRPFLDESGRLPAPTLAPFAIGLGAATAATAVVFGFAMLLAGFLPLAWGVWAWVRGAGEEWTAAARATGEAIDPDEP